jgi:hypothetical protein
MPVLYHDARAPVGQFLFIIEDSRPHSDTPHWEGLLWTSDQPNAETSTWQHKTHDRHPYPRRDSNLLSQQVSGHRPRGQWDQQRKTCSDIDSSCSIQCMQLYAAWFKMPGSCHSVFVCVRVYICMCVYIHIYTGWPKSLCEPDDCGTKTRKIFLFTYHNIVVRIRENRWR